MKKQQHWASIYVKKSYKSRNKCNNSSQSTLMEALTSFALLHYMQPPYLNYSLLQTVMEVHLEKH